MTAEQRRALVVTVSWRALVAALALVAAWVAAGMVLGGDAGYQPDTYGIARAVPGGIRAWGLALAACTVAAITGLNLYVHADRPATVRWALAGLTAWWAAWTAAMVGSWLLGRHDPARPVAVAAGVLVLGAAVAVGRRVDGPAWAMPAAAGAWLLAWGAGLHIPAWGDPAEAAAMTAAAWLASRSLAAARSAEVIAPGWRR